MEIENGASVYVSEEVQVQVQAYVRTSMHKQYYNILMILST